jgi:branched-chain amino acid transport system ATP-binding protein
MITLDGIDAGYGGGLVLRGVSLEIADRDIVCIVGPNGAGKSTVLKVMCGLLPPVAGKVRLGDADITGLSPSATIKRGLVMVPQSNALFPHLTVRENVLLGAYVARRDRAAVRTRFAELGELFPILRDRAGTPAGMLSGGQRRMVEFARSLMTRPRAVLLDEPSIGLDPKSLAFIAEAIGVVASAGTTVVLVEQNVRFGLELANTGVIMEGGRVHAVGQAQALLEDPEMRAVFIGGHAAGRRG